MNLQLKGEDGIIVFLQKTSYLDLMIGMQIQIMMDL